MSKRGQELLLELLLLSLRYTKKDIDWAQRELARYPQAQHLRIAFEMLNRRSPTDLSPERLHKREEEDTKVRASTLIAKLDSPRSAKETRKLVSIARRLGITTQDRTNDEVISIVKQELDKMDLSTLHRFLGASKSPQSPDEDYLGLAEYLIHRGYR
ncbi:hypothetical protein [Labrys wisconsinensis]|jgi:hypothetical protein|uniref:Uncharacterized protein n=1 Tax=Labrys wisconsinensis TaxID=425677 RepID=A0ABU0J1P1_9HYPH|nr:hypothetical protein [Labrys wisconsinensis]MDQ0468177.1 hypothetical protein [Labrys wisconsinensis]